MGELMVNVPVPRINTLHCMPSLLHLPSTQSELGNCNVHYSGFDTDLSTPASVDDQINTNDDSVTDPVIEKCPCHRNTICLSLSRELGKEIPLINKIKN
jgi:hypothetical protein